jgi:molybdopterin molybdotransferase
MISFEDALNIVCDSSTEIGTETVGFTNSLGRVLAKDIVSDMDMPPFDKSAVDGFACKITDINHELTIVETIQAGKHPEKVLSDNQCSKIMTGAMVPHGADCVLMVEYIDNISEHKIRFMNETTHSNICYRGEDIKKGQTVLLKGTLIKPEHIAVMATVGCVNPEVYKSPVVGIISTGNEIVEPEIKPEISKIRNCNAFQMMAQCSNIKIPYNYLGIAHDSPEATEKIIKEALLLNDIVILTGGVSMGDYDYVPMVMKKLGVKILFQSIAVQPGKPTVFGTIDNKYIFGLPGNPVSSFIQFELIVKPLIFRIMGRALIPTDLKLSLGKDYKRKKADRKAIVPVKIETDGCVYPVEFHGSAHINSLSGADGLMFVEKGCGMVNKGEIVSVRQI